MFRKMSITRQLSILESKCKYKLVKALETCTSIGLKGRTRLTFTKAKTEENFLSLFVISVPIRSHVHQTQIDDIDMSTTEKVKRSELQKRQI